MYDLNKLRKNSEPVAKYLKALTNEKAGFKKNAREYSLDVTIIKKLKKFVNEIVVYAFSAEWCPDCHKHIPVLGSIANATGLEVNVFGHLMRVPKKPKGFWKIPPSPPEVEVFAIKKIPTILVFDNKGNKIGEIIENPPKGKTLEKTLLDIIIESY